MVLCLSNRLPPQIPVSRIFFSSSQSFRSFSTWSHNLTLVYHRVFYFTRVSPIFSLLKKLSFLLKTCTAYHILLVRTSAITSDLDCVLPSICIPTLAYITSFLFVIFIGLVVSMVAWIDCEIVFFLMCDVFKPSL